MSLTRTQVSLSDDDRRVLDAVSRRTGRSMSALIRDAIQATYGRAGDLDRVEAALAATFGVVGRDVDGRDAVDRLRSGSRLAAPS
ncbi:ribbon-helix-helix protein, CopG family [Streptomyces sp. AC495_CC817]|uniref:ribbon-helix-helix protein, CopG family n=1 Tax=Streptomyces sp. AC495_CC817 TaxID=2823900 RepID=UPI001C26DFF7|nr:ribbon-helix-helix protein, CopG family [Streptomyces sp. AC495_CC817]